MPLRRTHSTSQKVYIPNNARDNQYLLANIELDEKLVCAIDPQFSKDAPLPYKTFYKQFRNKLFALCEQFELKHVHFIANDKKPLVRFNNETQEIETEDKIIFFYNPRYHQGQKYFYDFNRQAKRLSILFLATGDTIRSGSANFHQQVTQLLAELCQQLPLSDQQIRLRDHQHVTYDFFSKSKEKLDTQSYKFRPISTRYQANGVVVPDNLNALTYIVADVAITTNTRKLANIDYDGPSPYLPLFKMITNLFTEAMTKNNVKNAVVVANGLAPLVRFSEKNEDYINKGCQMIGYNPAHNDYGILSLWDAEEFVDTVKLVFMATNQDKADGSYGKYINQVSKVLESFADSLQIDGSSEQLMVRIHQHIAYNL